MEEKQSIIFIRKRDDKSTTKINMRMKILDDREQKPKRRLLKCDCNF